MEKRCAVCGKLLEDGEYNAYAFNPDEGDIYGALDGMDFGTYTSYMMQTHETMIYRCKDRDACAKVEQEKQDNANALISVSTAFKDLYENMGFIFAYYTTPICTWEMEEVPVPEGAQEYLLDDTDREKSTIFVTDDNVFWTKEDKIINKTCVYTCAKNVRREMQALSKGAEYLLKNFDGEKTLHRAYVKCEAVQTYLR